MTKKYISFNKSPFTVNSDIVPDSQCFVYWRKYYHFFKQNALSAHIRKKKIHITESNFDKYLEPRRELTRFAWSKPLQ